MVNVEKQNLISLLPPRQTQTLHLTFKASHKTLEPSLGGRLPTSLAGLTDLP